ncbi:hypothetical protein Leryth_008762 [Lithospermum erythrorhizon]|nr:hypothetical protein Leryth_008762 [Lithospermum erythrorhizon]
MAILSLFTLLLIVLLSSFQFVTSQVLHDQIILLSLGYELGVPGWSLNSSDHCSWPGIVCSLNNSMVERLDLSGHGLQVFGNLSELEVLDMSFNKFESLIPLDIGRLRNLRYLNLSNNLLTGGIPNELGALEKLEDIQFFPCCNLASNGFAGTIPPELGQLNNLQELIVSGNSLFGEIPTSVLKCKNLNKLDLSNNRFNGSIPIDICNTTRLQYLLLSQNSMRGEIPGEIGNCNKLLQLEMGSNYLTGTIPQNWCVSELQKSSKSSYSGNKGLCGAPLSSSCDSLNGYGNGDYHHRVSYRIILAVIGSGFLVFLSVTVVVCLFMMRERQEKAAKAAITVEEEICEKPEIIAGSVFTENLRQAIDFDAVVEATMKDSNKLSTGTFSTVYKAEMPSGMTLSVKKLKSMDRTILHQQHKMIRELEKLSKLSHDNLMRPIGFVIYEEVALLLHQYFPNGTLAHFLHESSKEPEFKEPECNILLDPNFKPLVGEVEISKLLDPSRGTANPMNNKYTMQVTAPGNVYSYGVVLLEILTTKLPVDESFAEGLDLVKWVHGAPSRGETPEQILDPRLSTVSFTWRKEMLAALKVALLCTDSTPAKRPRMKSVIDMLREIVQD